MTLNEALTSWITYRVELARLGAIALSTVANHGKIARQWGKMLGDIRLIELRKSQIDLAVAMMRQTRGPITLQADVAVLAQFLNWCVDERLIEARPRLPTVSVSATEEELPSDAAYTWVLKTVTPIRHAYSLEFMLLTGLSPHEVNRARYEDYDHDRKALGIGMRADFAVKTPSRRRWVPLNDRARILWNYAPFPTVGATEKAIQRARGGDMPPGALSITPKMMRKWFSSKVAGDVAEHVLQRLLGHSPGSRVTRRHYVRSSAEDAGRAVQGLNIEKDAR
jgi:integrase